MRYYMSYSVRGVCALESSSCSLLSTKNCLKSRSKHLSELLVLSKCCKSPKSDSSLFLIDHQHYKSYTMIRPPKLDS